jgi:hypothetical protein
MNLSFLLYMLYSLWVQSVPPEDLVPFLDMFIRIRNYFSTYSMQKYI